MPEPIKRSGVVLFTLEHTILKPRFKNGKVVYFPIENGIKLLKSCLDIDHFAVLITHRDRKKNAALIEIITKETGMVHGQDFGVAAVEYSEEGKPTKLPVEHTELCIRAWTEYCRNQNSYVTAGVTADPHYIDVFAENGIKTVLCNEETTQVDEFRKMTDEEIIEQQNAMSELGGIPPIGGMREIEAAVFGADEGREYPADEDSFGSDEPDLISDGNDPHGIGQHPSDLSGSEASNQSESSRPSRGTVSPDWQSDPIFHGDPAIEDAIKYPDYFVEIPKDWEVLDVYRVDDLFPINLPGASRLYHARKKLLLAGVRTGGKPAVKDIREAFDTLKSWLRDHDNGLIEKRHEC